MSKPRLTLITLGYRLNNIKKLSHSLASAVNTYKSYINSDNFPIDLTWYITIDAKNSTGIIELDSAVKYLEFNGDIKLKIDSHYPDIPYDPIGINNVINNQYNCNKDNREYFLLLDDDNAVLWTLFKYFIKFYNFNKDVMVFNMLNEFGNLISYEKFGFDLRATSMDPSRVAFNYNIYSKLGPIKNEWIPESQVLLDAGLFSESNYPVYDVTWYCKLFIPDQIISDAEVDYIRSRFYKDPQVLHNYHWDNPDFNQDDMNLVTITCYTDKTSITRVINQNQFEIIKRLLEDN